MENEHLVTTTKIDAARRQFHAAIELMFNEGDPVAVHTLIGAASIVVSDLVLLKCPDNSWDKHSQEATGMTASEYYSVMRDAQNFFKHANTDPDSSYILNPDDTDALAFGITLNLGELIKVMPIQLSIEERVFQLWYLACRENVCGDNFAPYKAAISLFGDLRNEPRGVRLSEGKRVMIMEGSKYW